jgi:hypothetical protein
MYAWTYTDTIHVECNGNAMSVDNVIINSINPITIGKTESFDGTKAISVDFSIAVESQEAGDALMFSGRLSKSRLDVELNRLGMYPVHRVVVGAAEYHETSTAMPLTTPVAATPLPASNVTCHANCSHMVWIVVSLSMRIASFDKDKQSRFRHSIAKTAGISKGDVSIENVANITSRRYFLFIVFYLFLMHAR